MKKSPFPCSEFVECPILEFMNSFLKNSRYDTSVQQLQRIFPSGMRELTRICHQVQKSALVPLILHLNVKIFCVISFLNSRIIRLFCFDNSCLLCVIRIYLVLNDSKNKLGNSVKCMCLLKYLKIYNT
jgi:hypothetical protein